MSRRARRSALAAGLAVALGLVLGAMPAAAHRLAPSLLELIEREGGRYDVHWKTPLLRPTGVEIEPELPARCRAESEPRVETGATSASLRWRVDCGERGLVGATLRVRGLDASRTDALLRVELRDGRSVRAVLNGADASLKVPAREDPWQVAVGYLRLGFEHILGGLDHLLFVLGLVLLVSGWRTLAATVTCFTLGHSVTLSLAALGFVAFPPGPIEVAIAFSILLLASELTRPADAAPTRMRRYPWVMALLFGLLHGFGFAGALTEVGLPRQEIPLALLAFNVGIEIGQLLFVAAVLALGRALRPLLRVERLAPLTAYGIGSLAAYWCFERAAGLLG